MNGLVRLREAVPDDLEEIIDYLAAHSTEAADRFILAVHSTLEDLSIMPGKGSLKHFRAKRLRELRSWGVSGFENYLILYCAVDGGIDVWAVLHGARNLAKILKQR